MQHDVALPNGLVTSFPYALHMNQEITVYHMQNIFHIVSLSSRFLQSVSRGGDPFSLRILSDNNVLFILYIYLSTFL